MRWFMVLTACSVLSTSLGGCVAADDLKPFDASRVILLQMEPLMQGEDIAVLSTDLGEFRMRFFPSEAPDAVKNFITLAKEGFYDGRAFYGPKNYLGEKDRVCLTGSSVPDGSLGVSRIGDKPFKREFSSNLWHFTGAVSVLGNKNEKGDSRFFVTGTQPVQQNMLKAMEDAAYPDCVVETFQELGGMPEYSFEYAVFAQVVAGQDVVDNIIAQMLESQQTPLLLESVEIVRYDGRRDES